MNRASKYVVIDSNATSNPEKLKILADDGVGLIIPSTYIQEAIINTSDSKKIRKSFDIFCGVEDMIFVSKQDGCLLDTKVRCWFSSPKAKNRKTPDGIDDLLTKKIRRMISSGNLDILNNDFYTLRRLSRRRDWGASRIMSEKGEKLIKISRIFATPKEAIDILSGNFDKSISERTATLLNEILIPRGSPKKPPLYKYQNEVGEMGLYVRPEIAYEFAVSVCFLVFFLESNSVGRKSIPNKRAVNDCRDICIASNSLLFEGLVTLDPLPEKIALCAREIISSVTGDITFRALSGMLWYDLIDYPYR